MKATSSMPINIVNVVRWWCHVSRKTGENVALRRKILNLVFQTFRSCKGGFINRIVNENHKSYRTPKPTIIDRRLFYQKNEIIQD